MTGDWVLAKWADLANRRQLGDVQVTFQCGGLVLCGTLIGGHEYFEGVGQLAVEGLRGAARSSDVTDAFTGLYEALAAEHSAVERRGGSQEHLHFKDVQILLGGRPDDAASTLEVPFWRVRVEAIDGFLLGGAIRHLPVSTAPAAGDEDPAAAREA